MKVDKFGIYRKMLDCVPISVGLPYNLERLIGKRAFYSYGNLRCIEMGIVEAIKLKEYESGAKEFRIRVTNIYEVRWLEWDEIYGWRLFDENTVIPFDSFTISEIRFQKDFTWYLTWLRRKIFG